MNEACFELKNFLGGGGGRERGHNRFRTNFSVAYKKEVEFRLTVGKLLLVTVIGRTEK